MTCRIAPGKARLLSPTRRAACHQSFVDFYEIQCRAAYRIPHTVTIDICRCARAAGGWNASQPSFTDYAV